MSSGKFEKFLEDLRRRLLREPAFHDNLMGTLEVSLNDGNLAGNITIKAINKPVS